VIIVLALGAGLGLGLWALAVGLFPPTPALHLALASGSVRPPKPILVEDNTAGWVAKVGRPFIAPLHAVGLPTVGLQRDLAVIGRPVATHLAEKATLALAGLLLPALAGLLFTMAGLSIGLEVPIIGGFALAGAGFLVPDLRARAKAAKQRTGFRHALSAYLDLVWITLAGGAGVDSALYDAAAVGAGWAFEQIRRALDAARLTRTTPWATLRQLGEEIDVAELAELAASVSLAGTEGAKVRASLAAKATALRAHQTTDAEGDAQAATERMSLPMMLLLLGFLIFIAFPALTQVLNGL